VPTIIRARILPAAADLAFAAQFTSLGNAQDDDRAGAAEGDNLDWAIR
jgi:hypothetical protein